MYLEENIRGLCDKFGLDFHGFLADFSVESVFELSVSDLEVICEEYNADLQAMLFTHAYRTNELKSKLEKIRLLVLDVDGVMTDGGMFFTEAGDEMKKFNTKDGMAILHLTKSGFQVAIISSGFKGEAVRRRGEILGVQHCVVSRDPKLETLKKICAETGIALAEVAIIGDDINDLELMREVGFSACPADAVHAVKRQVDVILKTRGGKGCIREFIDQYLLKEALH
jgi:YrbI family 3-deoxy-D-manno-octulosonate 8-phosphate phosphatase